MKFFKILCIILCISFSLTSCSTKPPKNASNNTSQKTPMGDTIKEPDNIVDKENKTPSEETPGEENPANGNTENPSGNTNVPTETLSNKKLGWYFMKRTDNLPPEGPGESKAFLSKYSGYYLGDTSKKELYLTFDEGYENGYTAKILDVLKANNVTAAFFVTKPYINSNKDLILRMVNEGHLVVNHSSAHPSMPDKTGDITAFEKEFKDVEGAFKELTGKDMPKFFRPPMGEYSEKSLAMTQNLGYKSIFWSFAHKDWLVDNQPSVQETHDRVIGGAHNGGILLLHAVSKSNTEALDSIIKDLKTKGYTFKSLESLK